MPDTPDQIADLTDAAAAGPLSSMVDGRSATNYSLRDRIALEQHRANTEAASTSGTFGVRFFNTRPPGAVTPSGSTPLCR